MSDALEDFKLFSYLQHQVTPLIEKFGWVCQSIFPTENEQDISPFYYTVGFWPRSPELIVVANIDSQSAQNLFLACWDRLQQDPDYQFPLNQRADQILANNYDLYFKECQLLSDQYPLSIAFQWAAYKQAESLLDSADPMSVPVDLPTALQVFFPDENNLFQWEDNFDKLYSQIDLSSQS